jgi:uncharacterized DUF497 family protein
MKFEFDPKKSASNKNKHGLGFIDGQELWEDPERLEVPAKTDEEQRYMLIGKISGKYWSAVFTIRDDKTRIISIRRSRTKEINAYENEDI